MIKDFRDKKHRPITFQDVLEEEAQAERKRQEEAERPVREAETALNSTTRKLYEAEKAEVVAGRSDPGWELPASVAGLSMSLDEARAFNNRESKAFVEEHPEFYRSKRNSDTVQEYLLAQGVGIADRQCFAQAVERLRHFGLLEEKPAEPEPSPIPVSEPQIEPKQEDLVDGFDENGNPIRVTQAALWKMSSAQLKTFYRMWTDRDGTDRRAKFTRSRYQ